MHKLGACRKMTPYAPVMKLSTAGLVGYVLL